MKLIYSQTVVKELGYERLEEIIQRKKDEQGTTPTIPCNLNLC